jgi:hypothetical protein
MKAPWVLGAMLPLLAAPAFAASDSFTGYNNDTVLPNPPWQIVNCTPGTDACIYSYVNHAEIASVGGHMAAYRTYVAYGPDQYSQATLISCNPSTSSSWFGVAVRISTTDVTYYSAQVQAGGGANNLLRIVKLVNGTATVLDTVAYACANNDVLRLQAVGQTLTATITGSVNLTRTVTDASVTNGKPGLAGYAASGNRRFFLDDWQADEVGAPSNRDWYVSPSGTTAGAGTLADPWPLSFAFAGADGFIRAGDTIWIRGGSYGPGRYTVTLNGTLNSPITYRGYPGELPVLDGGTYNTANQNFTVVLSGQYLILRDVDVFDSTLKRWWAVSGTLDPNGAQGVAVLGLGDKVINVRVHDTAQGFWLKDGGTLYGIITYNNGGQGDRGHGHGMYTNGRSDRYLINSISFNNFGFGFQGYSTADAVRKLHVLKSISFNANGLEQERYETNFYQGTLSTNRSIPVALQTGTSTVVTTNVWKFSDGTLSNITCTDTTCTVNTTSDSYMNDDDYPGASFTISGATNTFLNGTFPIVNPAQNSFAFTLSGHAGTYNGTSDAALVVTGPSHTQQPGDYIQFKDVSGCPAQLKDHVFKVGAVTQNTMELRDPVTGASVDSTAWPPYTPNACMVYQTVTTVGNELRDSVAYNPYGASRGTGVIFASNTACADNTVTNNYVYGGLSGIETTGCYNTTSSGNTLYQTSKPGTGFDVFVLPNDYEAGRCNVAIFNHGGAASATVDLSSCLKVGDPYQVEDVQNLGTIIASGQYSGPVSLPLKGSGDPIKKPVGYAGPLLSGSVVVSGGQATVTTAETWGDSALRSRSVSNGWKFRLSGCGSPLDNEWMIASSAAANSMVLSTPGVPDGSYPCTRVEHASALNQGHTASVFNTYLVRRLQSTRSTTVSVKAPAGAAKVLLEYGYKAANGAIRYDGPSQRVNCSSVCTMSIAQFVGDAYYRVTFLDATGALIDQYCDLKSRAE